MSVVIGCGAHGEACGWAVSSTVAVGGVHWCIGVRILTRWDGGQEGWLQLQSYSRELCMEALK
jgi:hypothetical protein